MLAFDQKVPEMMKRSRFSTEQIIAIPKEQAAGMATANVCRRHGLDSARLHKCKPKFSGLEVSEAQRLRALEEETARLRKLAAKATVDNAVLRDIASRTTGDARRGAGSCGPTPVNITG